PTRALLFIGSMGKTYASIISKEIDSTFAHTTRILAKMEQCGLIRFTFEGRIKFVELTEYGREVEAALEEFRDILAEEPPEDQKEESGDTDAEWEEAADEVGGNESEQAEELDPLSAEILEKIQKLRNKIESIHRDAVNQGDSRDTISRKLGPYSRDIKKLQNQIERAESPISETVSSALKESEELLESYLRS
ncbi:MAG TPA: MarR family transcriptional regulator, partial [Methanosarcina sp.]|nr:MarR family transcriptional regulator [Methanosarcina sp.]